MRVAKSNRGWVGFIGAVAVAIALLSLAVLTKSHHQHQMRQAEVAAQGAEVMPFDLDQTTHIFQPLDDGGLQTVVAKDEANAEQISLIQAHLAEEAAKFQAGDFSDPATIHGHDMPGLKALSAGHRELEVQYTALPNGAKIRYRTDSEPLVTAVHDWFAAQRSDHGHHAR